MSDHDEARVRARAADLLPEERQVGSDDPEAQAEAVLEESDERQQYLETTPDLYIEHRTSEETV